MFYRSKNLFMRPPFPEDWERVHALLQDEAIVRNLVNVPWPYRAQDAQDFTALAQDAFYPHFLITLPGEGVIGSAALVWDDGRCALGYWLGRAYWGKGYAAEAVFGLIEIAQMLGHNDLSARVFADNPRSAAVLRKVGFLPTGNAGPRFCKALGESRLCVEYVRGSRASAATFFKAA